MAPDRQRFFQALLIAALVIPVALAATPGIFGDGDVSWHIATGRWILANHAIPHADPFSFTWAGKPWVPIEWLAEVMLAAGYALAGLSGVGALIMLALVALHLTVFVNGTRSVGPWAMLAGIVAMDLVLIPVLLARPHVLAWPLLSAWLWLLLRARESDRAPPLAAATLMMVWVNLHGSFAIGLLLAAAFGLEALLATPDRLRVVRQWGMFGIACALAALVNANGLDGVLHPLRIANLGMLPLIDEWRPSSASRTPVAFALLFFTLALIQWRRARLSAVRALLLAGLLGLALLQMRHQAVLAISAAMLLPGAFARRGTLAPQFNGRAALGFGGLVALALIARAMFALDPPESSANPRSLIAAVPPELRNQPLLNDYSMGGPLILAGIRPYVDGRGDMYGDALVVGYKRIIDGDAAAFDAAVRRWDIRWTMLATGTPLIAVLDRSPGWKRLYADRVGVIHVRTAAAAVSASDSPRARSAAR